MGDQLVPRPLHNLYFSLRIMQSRKIKLEGHVADIGAVRNIYRILT
jgi:hypothetical protein